MKKFGSTSIGAIGFGAGLLGAALTVSANAAPVPPNGSFAFGIPATVDTGDITSATTTLVAGGPVPSITAFTDPFLGNPDNFCGAAGGGCTGSHPPGFLFADSSAVNIQAPNLPVGNQLPASFAELVQAISGGSRRGRVRLHQHFDDRAGPDDIELGRHVAACLARDLCRRHQLGLHDGAIRRHDDQLRTAGARGAPRLRWRDRHARARRRAGAIARAGIDGPPRRYPLRLCCAAPPALQLQQPPGIAVQQLLLVFGATAAGSSSIPCPAGCRQTGNRPRT